MTTDQPPLHGYVALYKGRRVEVRAPTAYAAQQQAAIKLRARKTYEVIVALCERADGSQVTHTPDF